jgi:hypothetical protein
MSGHLPAGRLYTAVYPYLIRTVLLFFFVVVLIGNITMALLTTVATVAVMAGADEWMIRRHGRTVFRGQADWGRTPFPDRLRQQDFGIGTLLFSVTFMLVLPGVETAWVQVLLGALWLAVAGLSVWRIIEHRRARKEGVVLSGMQLEWLRSVRASRGYEEAVAELRRLYPRIGRNHADEIIEGLFLTRRQANQ